MRGSCDMVLEVGISLSEVPVATKICWTEKSYFRESERSLRSTSFHEILTVNAGYSDSFNRVRRLGSAWCGGVRMSIPSQLT
jgi:hypothetical protein